MIGLLIVTHDKVGYAYEQLIEHVFGSVPQSVRVLNVEKDESKDVLISKAHGLINELNQGQGVVVLTDIFGATPCNIGRKLIIDRHVVMVTGLNASMIIKAVQKIQRDSEPSQPLHAVAEEIKEAAIAGIMVISNIEEEQIV